MPQPAQRFILGVLGLAALILALSLPNWDCKNIPRFIDCLVLTLVGAVLKVKLPRIVGTFSLSSVFILLGIVDLSLAEMLVVACAAASAQCLWRPKQKPASIQVLFSVANQVINVAGAYGVFHFARHYTFSENVIALLALSAGVLYTLNTGLLSIVLAFMNGKPVAAIWSYWIVWSLPYYLAGAVVAGILSLSGHILEWKSCVFATPLMLLAYLCYRLCVPAISEERLENV